MKRLSILITGVVISFALSIGAEAKPSGSTKSHGQSGEDIEGIWQGILNAYGAELRIVFKVSKGPDGTFTATMDSPDQMAMDIPVDEVTYERDTLRLEVKPIMGFFEGLIIDGGSAIEGTWNQGGHSLPLLLRRVDVAPEIRRPQEPQKPYPYDEEDVLYENKEAGITLAGTITLPRSASPSPAVLLISGSGPQNRDEMVYGHRPFLVLADYLTRRGIAVLRVDDRGVGGSTGSFSQAISEDFAGDVLAGVEYLKGREEVNPQQIGLIGHSEGGIIAPMVAARSPDIAFIVLMAGPGLTGEEILYMQGALIAKAHGADEKTIAKNRAVQERIFSVLKHEKDDAVAEERIREILANEMAELGEDEMKAVDYSEAFVDAQTRESISPWLRFFLTYDPKPTLMEVRCPVLAINGEKDVQVPPRENLRAIGEALQAGGNKNFVTKELSGLNHLFQTCETGSPAEYTTIEETISPAALQLVTEWILKQTETKDE